MSDNVLTVEQKWEAIKKKHPNAVIVPDSFGYWRLIPAGDSIRYQHAFGAYEKDEAIASAYSRLFSAPAVEQPAAERNTATQKTAEEVCAHGFTWFACARCVNPAPSPVSAEQPCTHVKAGDYCAACDYGMTPEQAETHPLTSVPAEQEYEYDPRVEGVSSVISNRTPRPVAQEETLATTYRKKPVVIEALRYTGSNADEIKSFTQGRCYYDVTVWNNPRFMIGTLEGEHIASPGDWIIKGVKGEFYPCKPDIFTATYEPATPQAEAGAEGECIECGHAADQHSSAGLGCDHFNEANELCQCLASTAEVELRAELASMREAMRKTTNALTRLCDEHNSGAYAVRRDALANARAALSQAEAALGGK